MYMYIQHLIELIIDTTCYHHEGQILIFDGQGSACLMVRTLWSDPRLIDDKIPMCVCACACSQAKYRMSCMVNIWWWFTRLNFWMEFMSLREILVMFVCDMPMFVGQTFVGEISYIYMCGDGSKRIITMGEFPHHEHSWTNYVRVVGYQGFDP